MHCDGDGSSENDERQAQPTVWQAGWPDVEIDKPEIEEAAADDREDNRSNPTRARKEEQAADKDAHMESQQKVGLFPVSVVLREISMLTFFEKKTFSEPRQAHFSRS